MQNLKFMAERFPHKLIIYGKLGNLCMDEKFCINGSENLANFGGIGPKMIA